MAFDALAQAKQYTGKFRASEVEMAVRSDLQRGRVPHSWYGTLKELKWDADKFVELIENELKGNKDANRNIEAELRREREEDSDRSSDQRKGGVEL